MNTLKKRINTIVLSVMLICSLFVVPTIAEEPIMSVNRITGVPADIEAGARVTLNANVEPSSATHQTITWKVKDAAGTGAQISGNLLRVPVGGNIIITATINDGIAIGKPYTQDFSINVEKNETEKIAIATAAVKKALDQYNPTNATSKQDITALVENAIINTGVTRVSLSWSSQNDFSKTNATISSAGSIRGQIDLICGKRYSSTSLNKTISILPNPNVVVKEESQTENKKPTPPKVESTPKKEASNVKDVYVNNKRVDESNYTINKETGTIVFKEEFIKTLPEVKKNVTVQNTGGESDYALTDTGIITLQENEVPATSIIATKKQKANNLQMILPFIVGGVVLAGLVIFYKTRKTN